MSGADYEVGYGRPPVETRFKPGRSGNPRGRKKGSRNVSTLVQEALEELVVVQVNGRRRKVTKLQAAFIQQANKAAAGDPKAVKLMLDVLNGATVREAGERPATTATSPGDRRKQDQLILKALTNRIAGGTDDGAL